MKLSCFFVDHFIYLLMHQLSTASALYMLALCSVSAAFPPFLFSRYMTGLFLHGSTSREFS